MHHDRILRSNYIFCSSMNLYFTESIYFIFFILRLHSWMRWQTFFLYKDLHKFRNAGLTQKYKRTQAFFSLFTKFPKTWRVILLIPFLPLTTMMNSHRYTLHHLNHHSSKDP